MSVKITNYSPAHLLGNTIVPRATSPEIRGSRRRKDPDGSSSVPYFEGVAGLKLSVEYTDAAGTPTPQTLIMPGNGFQAIISYINTVDPTNLEAVDRDGFLVLRSKNVGGANYLKILPQSVPAEEAAHILGFIVSPFPGSIVYAGEVLSTPPVRSQLNPQGTALIGRDEPVTSEVVNRAFVSVLQLLEDVQISIEREVLVAREFTVSAGTHTASGSPVFVLDDPNVRVPIRAVVDSGYPGVVSKLEQFFEVFDPNLPTATAIDSEYQKVVVTGAFYADDDDALNSAAAFSAWGTRDGGTIYHADVNTKAKQAAVGIDSIEGNIVHCPGALFQTRNVQKNDPIQINGALNDSPFSHNGWFAVLEVYDEEHLAVRPLSSQEIPPDGSNDKPRRLNSSGANLGNLQVCFGDYVPADGLRFVLSASGPTTLRVRMLVGVPLRDVRPEDLVFTLRGTPDAVSNLLYDHIQGTGLQHATADVLGFTSAQEWADGTAISGATLQATIEDLVRDLAASGAGDSAISRLGAEPVSIGGAAPNVLSSGTIFSQLSELLTTLRDHMNDSVAHAGAGATYSGSPDWADTTSIPGGVTIDAAIDQVVSDLAAASSGDDGAGKVGLQALGNWLGGKAIEAGSIRTVLAQMLADLSSTTANDDGAEKIGAQATPDLVAGSLRSQLDLLASTWGKLNRANTWSARQTFNGAASDTSPALETTYVPTTKKLLWEIENGEGIKTRLYVGDSSFGITLNAGWDGSQWVKDDVNPAAIELRIDISGGDHLLRWRYYTGLDPWVDFDWSGGWSGGGVARFGPVTVDGSNHKDTTKLSVRGHESDTEYDEGNLVDISHGGYSKSFFGRPHFFVSDSGNLRARGNYLYEEFLRTTIPDGWDVVVSGSGSADYGYNNRTQIRLSGDEANLDTEIDFIDVGYSFGFETDVYYESVAGDSYIGVYSTTDPNVLGFYQNSPNLGGSENLFLRYTRIGSVVVNLNTGVDLTTRVGEWLILKAVHVASGAGRIYWCVSTPSFEIASGVIQLPFALNSGLCKFRYHCAGQAMRIERFMYWDDNDES